jgi:inositol phosphorylceramide synthase catalytic subunit
MAEKVVPRAAGGEEGPVPRYPLAAAAVIGYAVVLSLSGKLGWQHLSLLVLLWTCLAPQEGPRRFMRDWWPMVSFWLAYDMMRIFSASLFPRVAVDPPFRLESRLFLAPDGTLWPFYFTRWISRHAGEFWPAVLSGFCNAVYVSHLFGIPVILLVVWLRRSQLLFRRLVWSLTLLHALSLAIYLVYPAAPPWWVYENGSLQPSVEHSMPSVYARGSPLSGLFDLSPNRFAAIPSLHAAYPLLLTLVLVLHGAKWRWIALAAFYTASMWFACVFLNQHYIIDLVIGAGLVFPALLVAALIKPLG